jgi:DNA-binding transcriptional LysR family regulator
MELRHLRYFAAVGREVHFGRAARKLNVAQPALSRTIRDLELELGFDLFERLPRGVRLTEAGQRYLKEVMRILDDLAAANRLARDEAAAQRCLVHIAHPILPKGMDAVLDRILLGFAHKHPDIIVDLVQLSSFDQMAAIRDRVIDAGFAHLRDQPIEGLDGLRIRDDPLCGVRIGVNNKLAGLKQVSIGHLRHELLLIFRRGRNPQVFDFIIQRLRTAGFKGDVAQNADVSAWNWKTIPRDSGWMLSPGSERDIEVPGTVWLPLTDFSAPFGLDFVWRSDDDSVALHALRSTLAQLPLGATGDWVAAASGNSTLSAL